MKHTFTKALSATLALLLCAALVACKDNTPGDGSDDERIVEPVAVDHVWKSEYISFPDGIRGYLSDDCVVIGDTLTMSGSRIISEEPYEAEPVNITFHISDRTFTWETSETANQGMQEADKDGFYWYTNNTVAYDGGEIVMMNGFNDTTGEEQYRLSRTAADGTTLWNINLQEQFQNASDRGWFYISSFVVNEVSQTIYVCTDEGLCAFDMMGKRLYEVSMDGYIESVFTAADGKTYIYGNGRNSATGRFGTVFCPLDDAKGGMGEAITVPETVDLQNANVFMAEGADLFYSNDTGFYSWNFADSEANLLCNWLNSDVSSDETRNPVVISDELILRQSYDPVTGAPQIAVMTPVPPEEVTPKYLIEVAYSDTGATMLQQYAVAFNRSSDKYRVVIKDYNTTANNTDKEPIDVLEQDIVSGYRPDVIIGDDYFNLGNLIDKGLFLDLYTYMDRDDAILSREDFVACVLEPFEDKNGALPLLTTQFSLSTYYAKASVVGNKSVWSIDDVIALQNSLSEGQYLFSMYLGAGDPEYGRDSKTALLELLLPYSLSAFVDEKTAKCTFDDGRFATLLEFCATCPVLDTATLGNDGTGGMFRDGSLVLKEDSWMTGISNYLQTKYYEFGGEDMAMIGYPTADPDVKNGTVIVPQSQWGITKDSPVADGAWEFITSTFGNLDENNYYRMHTFPSARAALDFLFEQEELQYYVFRENGWSGTSVAPGEEFVPDEWFMQEIEEGGVLGHMAEEDKAELLAIFESAELVRGTNTAILDLIREDVSAYFAGAKTLEETVNVIQSRVSVYVSETMG